MDLVVVTGAPLPRSISWTCRRVDCSLLQLPRLFGVVRLNRLLIIKGLDSTGRRIQVFIVTS